MAKAPVSDARDPGSILALRVCSFFISAAPRIFLGNGNTETPTGNGSKLLLATEILKRVFLVGNCLEILFIKNFVVNSRSLFIILYDVHCFSQKR